MSDGRLAGIDWACEEHAGLRRLQRARQDRGGAPVSAQRAGDPSVVRLAPRLQAVLVALERPDGLLIERLLDAGLAVIAVHPNQVKAMRPR